MVNGRRGRSAVETETDGVRGGRGEGRKDGTRERKLERQLGSYRLRKCLRPWERCSVCCVGQGEATGSS